MGILRAAFWLSAVVILLPAGNDNVPGGGHPTNEAKVSADQVVVAATSVAGDMSEFCTRQPGVCETSGAILDVFEAKAKNSVRLIYNWATEPSVISSANAQPANQDKIRQLVTSSPGLDHLINQVANTGTKPAGVEQEQNTLKLQDVIPDWSLAEQRSKS